MLYNIDNLPAEFLEKISGKAFFLSELSKRNISIPKTWILPISSIFVREDISRLKKINSYEEIVNIIGIKKMSDILTELTRIMKMNPKLRFCVRSSNGNEDGYRNSYAGIYDSYVNISNKADLLNKIVLVLLSYVQNGNDVLDDRFYNSSSIIIQEFIATFKSGVVYFNQNSALIEASKGLPIGIVNTSTKPESYFIDRYQKIEISSTNDFIALYPVFTRVFPIVGEDIKLFDGERGRVLEIDLENFTIKVRLQRDPSQLLFSEEELLQFMQYIRANISSYFTFNELDIEFGIDSGGKIFIFQLRPITTKTDFSISSFKNGLISLNTGRANGILVYYNSEFSKEYYDNKIVYINRIDGEAFYKIKDCIGLVVKTNSYLSHSSILARELNKVAVGLVGNHRLDNNTNYEICAEKNNLWIKKLEYL